MAIRMPAPSRTRSMLGSASTRGSQSLTLGSPAVARASDRGSFRFGTRTVAPNKPLHLTAGAGRLFDSHQPPRQLNDLVRPQKAQREGSHENRRHRRKRTHWKKGRDESS